MSRYQTYNISSRYNNVVILSGMVKCNGTSPIVHDGKGYKVTRFSPGVYTITMTDNYLIKGGSSPTMGLCEACAISDNLPIPYADLRAVNTELLDNKGTFRIFFLNNAGNATEPEWGFSFNIYITNSTAAGDT